MTGILNFCGIIRPIAIVVGMIGMLSILAPELWASIWPYAAAVGVMIVPIAVYRWWGTRYNPGCSVRFNQQEPAEPKSETP